jgi:RNA polymerase sigma-70 factor (ECF subfamily)
MNGDKLFSELVKRHTDLIKRIIRKYFSNTMDADDVYQEIIMHIHKKLTEESEDKLSRWSKPSWINTITQNKCLDIIKVQKNQTKKFHDSNSSEYFEFLTSNAARFNLVDEEKEVLKISVKELLKELKDKERTIIIMHFIKGYSLKEIAEILKLSNASVYLRRALDKLKEFMNGSDFFELFDEFSFTDEPEVERVYTSIQPGDKK